MSAGLRYDPRHERKLFDIITYSEQDIFLNQRPEILSGRINLQRENA